MPATSGTTIGFDISDRRIVVVESNVSPKSVVVMKSATAQIEPGIVDQGRIVNMDALANLCDTLIGKMKLATNLVAFNLPITTYVLRELPSDADYFSTPGVVEWEMAYHCVDDPKRYFLSYWDSGNSTLLIAANRGIVLQRIELFKRIGLAPIAGDPDNVALYNITLFGAQSLASLGNVLFVDIAYPNSSLSARIDGVFRPGGILATDEKIYNYAIGGATVPRNLDSFIKELSSMREFLFGKDAIFSTFAYSGTSSGTKFAATVEQLFELPIYHKEGLDKQKKIRFKGKHNILTYHEMQKAIGLSLRCPND